MLSSEGIIAVTKRSEQNYFENRLTNFKTRHIIAVSQNILNIIW